jgi:UPF0755 protein
MKLTKRQAALAFVFLVIFIVGIPTFAAMLTWVWITEPYKGYSVSEEFVTIQPGATANEIEQGLLAGGVIRDRWRFRAALWWTGTSTSLKAGEYRFTRPMTPIDVLTKIGRGDVYVRKITFAEGLNVKEMAKVYESRGFGPASDFVAAAGDASLIADLDPGAPDLEGYLYPETYSLPRTGSASRLVRMMVGHFKTVVNDDMRQRAMAQGLTIRQLVTLASLVEKETGKADERPLIAAVYRNRLKIGMGLQADPTIVYALERAGRYDGNIHKQDLAFDSPYNTYKYPGLPPGPIASPGKASLDAALDPADVPYLYFVSRNDGSHVFATTLQEHNRNVQKFQVAYFRAKRAEEAAKQSGARGRGGR